MDQRDQDQVDLPDIPREKDYSQRPQKPIRLKDDLPPESIGAGPYVAPPEQLMGTGRPRHPPLRPPRRGASRWTLSGVDPAVREEAQAAARAENISVAAWVERALRRELAAGGGEAASTTDATLARIEQRLEALERRPSPWGWLRRLLGGP